MDEELGDGKGGGCVASLSFRTRWLFRGGGALVPEAEKGLRARFCFGCPFWSCQSPRDPPKLLPNVQASLTERDKVHLVPSLG